MELYINNQQSKKDISGLDELVKKIVEATLQVEQIDDEIEVGITFVDDKTIQELNQNYRHINSPTDVLSFPQDTEGELFAVEQLERILGDIVISLERASLQAKEYGHSLAREVGYLTAHGLLHLLGYDHQKEEQKKIMRFRENLVMEALNLMRD